MVSQTDLIKLTQKQNYTNHAFLHQIFYIIFLINVLDADPHFDCALSLAYQIIKSAKSPTLDSLVVFARTHQNLIQSSFYLLANWQYNKCESVKMFQAKRTFSSTIYFN